ncbi:uncharacterized protein LOC127736989 [Mytilus californianus]|uniref:uncharacterized protein LOC127736989 n=1 Tax=Mytilus californianus TaxID=6549 RepID=UPI002247725A|nr:uncharacterized protein LOC127736989 [Mytilus californianus]
MHLMRIQLIYYFVQLLTEPCVKGFNIICPGQHQRIFRSKEFCKTIENPVYLCLYNTFSLQYSENCTKMEYASRKGRKIVLSPAINEIDCKDDRFQPIPFTTNSFTDCLFGKSKCNEEGQVLISDGSTIMDRTCRCDYRNGYAYVTQPKDKCFCVPSQEDCSCFSKHCKENEMFSADYRCVLMNSSRSNVCGEILDGPPTTETTNINNIFVDNKEYPRSFSPSALTGILILLFITIVLIMMFRYLLPKV